jgi:hypothetical protein
MDDIKQRYIDEATEKGMSIVEKISGTRFIFKRDKCGHLFEADIGSVRHNKCSHCTVCASDLLQEYEKKFGLTLVEKLSNIKNKYKIGSCGHNVDLFKTNVVRQDSIKCPECEAIAFTKHLDKFGLELVEYRTSDSIETANSDKVAKLRFKSCGHITNRIRSLKKNYAPCKECKDAERESIYSKNGIEFVEKVSLVKSLVRFLACGHERVVYDSAALRGNCVCHQCNESTFNKKSKIYLLKIMSNDGFEFLKFGYGKDIPNRVREYRMVGVESYSILYEDDFASGSEALSVEKSIHKKFKNHRLQSDVARKYLTRGGFSECYPIELLDDLLIEIKAVTKEASID